MGKLFFGMLYPHSLVVGDLFPGWALGGWKDPVSGDAEEK